MAAAIRTRLERNLPGTPRVIYVPTQSGALKILEHEVADAILVDQRLAGYPGLDFAKLLNRSHPGTDVLLLVPGGPGWESPEVVLGPGLGLLNRGLAPDSIARTVRDAAVRARERRHDWRDAGPGLEARA